jgi:hypothetical protein
MSEQPFVINAGMLSIQTNCEDRRRVMALRTSEPETDAKYEESGD